MPFNSLVIKKSYNPLIMVQDYCLIFMPIYSLLIKKSYNPLIMVQTALFSEFQKSEQQNFRKKNDWNERHETRQRSSRPVE